MNSTISEAPPPAPPRSAVTRLAPDRQSPRLARRFVAEHLAAWGCAHLEEVTTLLVSELVTNGVTHAATPVAVAVGSDGDTVAVAVTDGVAGGVDLEGHGRARPRGAPSGRGLHIVDALADRWGVSVHEGGKTIWFEVAARPT